MPPVIREVRLSERRRIAVEGAVQGVGFRSFVYHLAIEHGLDGWVQNTGEGVIVEAEGEPGSLDRFQKCMERDKPRQAHLSGIAVTSMNPHGRSGRDPFHIEPSASGHGHAVVPPDVATCDHCLAELMDPANRRFCYPFTACDHCGPRYSIVRAKPFDRENTTMRGFPMCAACRAEYENPDDRRFHAQLIACPQCGPRVALWNRDGRVLAQRDDALRAAARAIDEGLIVALKSIGGFQLLADACRTDVVERLRRRKHRDAKPFAVMFPLVSLVDSVCEMSSVERQLLESPEAPIVILRRHAARDSSLVAEAVAPGNPNLGVILPYTPMYHLLMGALYRPMIVTSGNVADEPVCIDEHDALEQLGDIADIFLVHNRPIVRQVDDSVARVIMGRPMVVRRARGYAPLPIRLGAEPPPMLAVGGHIKATIAITSGPDVMLSQHIGDLGTIPAYDAFVRVVDDLERLYGQSPSCVAHDATGYRSTRYAADRPGESVAIQHHVAHVLACLADNAMEVPCLGVTWDGTGFGPDGTIWGGEWFQIRDDRVRRVGCLRPFRLPGGEKAVREPRRAALGLLHAMFGESAFARKDLELLRNLSDEERRSLPQMFTRGINAPLTTSAGRLFDAVAGLLGFGGPVRYEGEAAMALEYAAMTASVLHTPEYACVVAPDPDSPAGATRWRVDWANPIKRLLEDHLKGRPSAEIAAQFHETLVDALVEMATRVGEDYVALSGGCFQNALLLERAITRLRVAGFKPLWHQRVPPNDGALALGQVVGAARHLDLVE